MTKAPNKHEASKALDDLLDVATALRDDRSPLAVTVLDAVAALQRVLESIPEESLCDQMLRATRPRAVRRERRR